MDKLTQRIGEGLSERLGDFKFVKSRSLLIKQTSEGWQAIGIEVLSTSKIGIARVAAHAQIRLDRVEEMCSSHNPFMSPSEARTHATVTTNCDELLSENPVIHGFKTDEKNTEMFLDVYADALRIHVIPWLDEYSNEDAVFNGLIDEDPMNWITSDRLTRYPVILAVLANRNDWREFDRVAEEFRGYCNSPHAQVYKPFAESLTSGLRATI